MSKSQDMIGPRLLESGRIELSFGLGLNCLFQNDIGDEVALEFRAAAWRRTRGFRASFV